MRIIIALLSIVLISACSRGDKVSFIPPDIAAAQQAPGKSTPNEFATFINKQYSLPAGQYKVALSAPIGSSASYTLNVRYANGNTESRAGAINNALGKGTACIGLQRPCVPLMQAQAGGIQLSVDSSVAVTLQLLDQLGQVVPRVSNTGNSGNITISESEVSDTRYAQAYYAAIDPNNERTTLAAFKAKNGFGSNTGQEVQATFRDVKDLGYGRRMFARKNTDGSMAFFVENYFVEFVPGSPTSNYGPLNLDAAVAVDRRFHIGTNAIEFSPLKPGDDVSTSFVKFYTYSAGASESSSERLLLRDMDGRGEKAVPSVCFSCHGGRLLPLNPDGSFPRLALRSPKLNLLESRTFEFSDQAGFTEAEMESALRTINHFAFLSYPETVNDGDWDSSYAREVANGRYQGQLATNQGSYDESFVPAGWKDNAQWQSQPARKNPTGTELLFKQVIEPHCYSCHSLQGALMQASGSPSVADATISTSVNFSSYEKFKEYEDEIVEYVYKRGNMPLSLRNYERFWLDPKGAPTIMAAHLGTAYDVRDASGNLVVREPGLPFAKAGTDRRVKSPVQLNAQGSLLSAGYSWSLVNGPAGAVTSFSASDQMLTLFNADQDGVYTIRLTVSNEQGSDTDDVNITISSGLSKGQRDLSFQTDIRPILGSNSNSGNCTSCHASNGATNVYDNIPVFYTDADNSNLYAEVMARVDLADPENSPLLRKPLNNNHVGGQVFAGVQDPDYLTLLNWIRAGAMP